MLKIVEYLRPIEKEKQLERLNICRGCKFYKKETASCGPLIIGRELTKEEKKEIEVTHYRSKIRLCGCRMKEKVKYGWAACPINKWGAILKLGDVQLAVEERNTILTYAKGLKAQGTIEWPDNVKLFDYGSQLMGKKQKPTTCPPCVRDMINFIVAELGKMEMQTA